MKFLCPSCKAKYQIADEKVAGRSVRMKCRKCAYVIEIGKAVVEGAAESQHAPAVGPSEPAPARSSAPPAARPTGPVHAGGRPGIQPSAPTPKPAPVRPGAAGAGSRPLSRTPTPPPRVQTARPAGTSSLAPARPAPARPPPRAAVTSVPRAAAPVRPSSAPLTPTPTALNRSVAYATEEDKHANAPASALAGAFAQAVESQRGEALSDVSMPADEWYVGINGVPVGPIRLSELRSKASVGAVTTESLVWREGFEQWQALKTFPELVAIVEESLSSARASQAPLAPPPGHTNGGGQSGLIDAFGRPTSGAEGFSVAVGAAPVTGPAVVTEKPEPIEEMLGLRPRRTSMAAWIAVVVALLFGLTIGFVVFSRKAPAEPVVKYVEVPAKGKAAAPSTSGTTPSESIEESTVASGPAKPGGKAAPAASKPTDKPPDKALTGLSGLAGLQGNGPSGGPGTTNAATSSAGQPLDGTAVQRTVGRYTSSVRRSCWQPALDARDKDAPTSARVNVTITVSPSGSVQNVSTSGDPRGYRGLAGCIASRVRGWQFSASSGTTTVNVPFVFAAQ